MCLPLDIVLHSGGLTSYPTASLWEAIPCILKPMGRFNMPIHRFHTKTVESSRDLSWPSSYQFRNIPRKLRLILSIGERLVLGRCRHWGAFEVTAKPTPLGISRSALTDLP